MTKDETSPAASLAAARREATGAAWVLLQRPGECSPYRVPGIIRDVNGMLCSAAAIIACLGQTDLDPGRRELLRGISADMGRTLADFRALARAAP